MTKLPVFVVAAFAFLAGCSPSGTVGPEAARVLPSVAISRPEKLVVQDSLEYTGRVEASQRVEVRSRVSGYLQAIKFRDGQFVKKGDPLFIIDPRPFVAARDRAQASVAHAAARQKLAAAQFERVARLHRSAASSTEELDRTRSDLETAQASVLLSQAELSSAELELSFTAIRAPIAGQVSDRRIDAGNYVAGGGAQGGVLTTIVVQRPLRLVVDLPEADYLRLRQQSKLPQQVQLSLEGIPGAHSGTVDFLDNEFSTRSGTLRLRATVPNDDQSLMPGSFARVRVPVGTPRDHLLVPDSAIQSDQTRKLVLVVDAAGTVASKQVELGGLVGTKRVISSGLESEDQVIVSGSQRVRPGDRVQIATSVASE